MAGGAGNVPLRGVRLEPPANYGPTKDPADAAQLTDGEQNRFPFWTSRDSVGWLRQTPVSIFAQPDLQDRRTYELLIHTGKQVSSGVLPPRRVDVYCQTGAGQAWHHTGSLVPDKALAADGGTVDLPVRFCACTSNRLQFVVHADGAFIMLDEISLAPVAMPPAACPAAGTAQVPVAVTDPVADSRRRLEEALAGSARQRLRSLVGGLGVKSSLAWLSEPWSDLGEDFSAIESPGLSVVTLADTPVSYVVGIANPSAAEQRYSLKLDPAAGSRTTVSELLPVPVADGKLVFDAIDTHQRAEYALEAEGVLYLLLQEKPGGVSGRRTLVVTSNTGWKQTLTLQVRVLNQIRPVVADRPWVLVWAYTNDEPIWHKDNAGVIAERLAAAGVNVFDIFPGHIPAPLGEKDWEARVAALKADLALYRDKGLVLLFLGDAVWGQLVNMPDDAGTKARVIRWVKLISGVMKDSGFASGDWAFYPIDEPHGKDLANLADVIRRLRAIDPGLQFYANPIQDHGLQAVLARLSLRDLNGLVNYWQPKAGAAYDSVAAMLDGSAKSRLWTFDTPPDPAKSASPVCYRAMVTRAFDTGARGVGFWAFSDTAGSSAWNDFDGKRPDWAVVYEGDDGFVSSRRWEGFQQGVRDFAALSYCARQTAEAAPVQVQCQAYRRWVDAGIQARCGD